ncbi:MAG: chemotaxis protein CheW [Pseudomonadota bacterium]
MSAEALPAGATTLQSEDGLDQYLTFHLAGEEYGVDILRVQEIKGWSGVTPIPNMPDSILGVINLRGTIVPVVDLRRWFGLEPLAFEETTVVIVLHVSDGNDGERTIGVVVDAVSEVHNIGGDDLKPAPELGGVCSGNSVRGLATRDNRMIIILDVDHLMSDGLLQTLERDRDN